MKKLILIFATAFCIVGATEKVKAQQQIISAEQCKKIVDQIKSNSIGEAVANYSHKFLFWRITKWDKQVTIMSDCQLWEVRLVKPTKDFPVQFIITAGPSRPIYTITPTGQLYDVNDLSLRVDNFYLYTPEREYMPKQPAVLTGYVETMKKVFANIGG